jgi:4-amino-4-deoxy-L-arabinose transferase-like glycosyltransferase
MAKVPQALDHAPAPPGQRRRAGAVAVPLLLVAACAFLLLYGFTAGELYRTEGLRAILGAEFLRGAGRVVPTLYGEPLLTKPPGMYAAIALASWPAGAVSAATARLPSVVAAGLAVWLFYRAFRRHLGRRAGLTAAALLPASFLWLDRVPSAEIDMLQLAWVAAAVLLFLRALELHEAPGPRRRWAEWLWWQAALLCVAGGLLTKWTAPAFFYLTAVPLLWWRGRLRCLWQAPHLAAAALAALPCLAWAGAAVAAVGWGTVYETVAREALLRLSPAHHPRPYPWGELLEFPAGVLLANLPWSLCLLPALRPSFARLWDERGRRLLQALHCWAWVNLLFWAVVPGHRPRHALPLQPALAGLAAMVWHAWLTGRLPWPLPARLRPLRVLVSLLVLWLAVKLAFVHVLTPRRGAERGARRSGEHLAALVPGGEVLYLCGLKDEGMLFYYGRPARRVADTARLPRAAAPLHCLLTEAEWRSWLGPGTAEVLHRLRDEQGVGCVLVRVR